MERRSVEKCVKSKKEIGRKAIGRKMCRKVKKAIGQNDVDVVNDVRRRMLGYMWLG